MIVARLALDAFCIGICLFVWFWLLVLFIDMAGFDNSRQMVIDALMGK